MKPELEDIYYEVVKMRQLFEKFFEIYLTEDLNLGKKEETSEEDEEDIEDTDEPSEGVKSEGLRIKPKNG